MSLAKTAAQAAKRVIAASKPTKINGRWRQPELSGRSLAKARKEWEATFTEPWPLQKERGQPNQKPKGHKHERLKAERLVKIEQNMKDMDRKVEEFRDKQRASRQQRRAGRQLLAPALRPK